MSVYQQSSPIPLPNSKNKTECRLLTGEIVEYDLASDYDEIDGFEFVGTGVFYAVNGNVQEGKLHHNFFKMIRK